MEKYLDWAPEIEVPIPHNEIQRLEALGLYEDLDHEPSREAVFDRLAQLAAEICEVPVSFINLIPSNKEFKKACYGIDGKTTQRTESFCQFTIMDDNVFEVEDAKNHPIFKTNPNVTGDFNLQFYAGMPLTTPEGFNVGSLCVIDYQPKKLTHSQKIALKTLAQEVVSQFELTLSRKKLEILLKEKDEMLKLVSHDMRNPLMGIIGASDLLKTEIEDEELGEMIDIVNDSGKNLLGIVNTILNSEYIKNEGFILSRKNENVTALCDSVIQLHKASVLVKDLHLKVTYSPSEIYFKIDDEKWKQIFGNLLSNAIKFTPKGGEISVILYLDETSKTLTLQVKDNGLGIPNEIMPNLFSGDKSTGRKGTENEETTGIGLPFVKRFVELHRGKISCESIVNNGSTFTVNLPN